MVYLMMLAALIMEVLNDRIINKKWIVMHIAGSSHGLISRHSGWLVSEPRFEPQIFWIWSRSATYSTAMFNYSLTVMSHSIRSFLKLQLKLSWVTLWISSILANRITDLHAYRVLGRRGSVTTAVELYCGWT